MTERILGYSFSNGNVVCSACEWEPDQLNDGDVDVLTKKDSKDFKKEFGVPIVCNRCGKEFE